MALPFVKPVSILLSIAVAACAGAPHTSASAPNTPASAPSTSPVAPSAERPSPTVSIRPEDTAGVYWIPYQTCYDCDKPAAIVAYVTPNQDVARKVVAKLSGTLELGLPYVVHTDELGVQPSGIAVVTGTYGSRDAAAAAAAKMHAIAGRAATVIDLVADAHGETDGPPPTTRLVTVVDRGPSVAAYSKRDVDAVKAELDNANDPGARATRASERKWLADRLHKRAPLCVVKPGELFVVEDRELDWYSFAPVRCGNQLAYIEWTRSLLGHAVIVPDGTGHRLYQIVGAECDHPLIDDWRYDSEGRHRADQTPPLLASAGC